MKIIDAVWEKRNLGVSTQEITIEPTDTMETVKTAVERLNAQYQVIKVPTGMIEIMWYLENLGFRYIETTIHVSYDLSKLALPDRYKRIDDAVVYAPMNADDIDQMFKEVQKGMFLTDRVAVDPFFSLKQASNRYEGWLRDELVKGCTFYKYEYKGKVIGFFALKKTAEKEYYPFLAGIYKEYQGSPLGAVYLYKPMLEAKRLGGESISTHISTNNTGAFRIHVDYGFTFKESHCVFVRHQGE